MNIKELAEKAGFFTHKEVMPQIEKFAALVLEEAARVCDELGKDPHVVMHVAEVCGHNIRALKGGI